MTGFNLPPGVSVSMIPGNRPEDELADMIADGWRPHCSMCGGFLKIVSTEHKVEKDKNGLPWEVEFNTCRKCGHENVEMSYPMYDPDDFNEYLTQEKK